MKAGDKVKCINPDGYGNLCLDNVYTVLEYDTTTLTEANFCRVKQNGQLWSERRFEPYEEPEANTFVSTAMSLKVHVEDKDVTASAKINGETRYYNWRQFGDTEPDELKALALYYLYKRG